MWQIDTYKCLWQGYLEDQNWKDCRFSPAVLHFKGICPAVATFDTWKWPCLMSMSRFFGRLKLKRWSVEILSYCSAFQRKLPGSGNLPAWQVKIDTCKYLCQSLTLIRGRLKFKKWPVQILFWGSAFQRKLPSSGILPPWQVEIDTYQWLCQGYVEG